jgi:hypothetical protein
MDTGMHQALFRTSNTKQQQDKGSALLNLLIKAELACLLRHNTMHRLTVP